MKYVIWALRIIVGLLFIFSGLVKANDPLGLTYKMDEFFEVWNMGFMTSYTLALSVAMIAFEVICGFAMLVGSAFRLYSTLLLLLSVFFTFLTAYALYSGKIKECGCFGDCIKISNTATFWKDVVLTAFALVLFLYRGRVRPIAKPAVNITIMTLAVAFAFGFQWWTLHHLPVHDCLAYREGNNIWQKMQRSPDAKDPVYQTIMIYEKNGVKKEFTTENYPWQDSTWKFVDSKTKLIKEGTGQPEIHDFSLTDSSGADQTQAILMSKGYTFIWFVRKPESAHTDNMDRIRTLAAKAAALHIPFYVACSSSPDLFKPYRMKWNIANIPQMTIDYTVVKTAMRTDPGLMLLNNGVVEHKWSYLDYPKDMDMSGGKLEFK